MMLKFWIAPAVASLFLLSASATAEVGQAGQAQPQPQQEQRVEQRVETDLVIRADRLTGQAVVDRQGERIGRIDDLAVNLNDDQIAYAVVSHGGVWGIGGEQVAVQWEQIQPDPAQRVVRFDGTEAQLQQAQRIDVRSPWPMVVRREGEPDRPVGTVGPEARPADPAAREHQAVGMSRIIGMNVENPQGERLGHIDDVTIERDGSLGYAVIAHGGFLGIGHNYVAVPWDRFDVNVQQERLMLNITQQQLEAAPRFEYGERWPGRVDWPFGEQQQQR